MTASAFERLCEEFCELARVPAPELTAEDDGVVAFHATWRGVTIDVLHDPQQDEAHAFVTFELGTVPAQEPRRSRIWEALLKANHLLMRLNAPTFSCHPETGAAMLQCVFPLFDLTPSALYKVVEEGVSVALEWRESFFLCDDAGSPGASADAGGQVAAGFA
jgi:hypothetical protein